MLPLKLQYFGHLIQTDDSLEKSLMLGKIEGRRRRGHQRMRWLDGITHAMDMNLGKLQERMRKRGLACCSPWGHKESDKTEQQQQYNQGNKIQKAGGWHSALEKAADMVARIPGFWTCVSNLPTRWCCPFKALVLACVQ